jgi:hypothetical protein
MSRTSTRLPMVSFWLLMISCNALWSGMRRSAGDRSPGRSSPEVHQRAA